MATVELFLAGGQTITLEGASVVSQDSPEATFVYQSLVGLVAISLPDGVKIPLLNYGSVTAIISRDEWV